MLAGAAGAADRCRAGDAGGGPGSGGLADTYVRQGRSRVKGDQGIIELLNEVLTAELTAVNQYFLDSRMFANWGYERLATRFYDESLGEMKDADELIETHPLSGWPTQPATPGERPCRRDPDREAVAGPRCREGGHREAQ